jgi:predicted phosphodiesterase
MRILQISDTHYGFNEYNVEMLSKGLSQFTDDDFDVVIHCGDWISHDPSQFKPFLELLRSVFKTTPICGVLGNHDLWGSDINISHEVIYNIFNSYNIQLLSCGKLELEKFNTVIYGFDGWYGSDDPSSNDSRKIKKFKDFGKKVNYQNSNEYSNSRINVMAAHMYLRNMNYKQLSGIVKNLDKNKRNLIVTHHNPIIFDHSYMDLAGDSRLLKPIINNFELCFFGHTHKYCDIIEHNEHFTKFCRLINCGSDYTKFTYKIIELEDLCG